MAQPVIVTRRHCYPDMQVLEDVVEITTARPVFEVLLHDATLTDMNMQASYPECEGANLYTILDSTIS